VKRFINTAIVLGCFSGHLAIIALAWLCLLVLAPLPTLGFACGLVLAGVFKRVGPLLGVRYVNWRVARAKAAQS
jgi:hypothetical protein